MARGNYKMFGALLGVFGLAAPMENPPPFEFKTEREEKKIGRRRSLLTAEQRRKRKQSKIKKQSRKVNRRKAIKARKHA